MRVPQSERANVVEPRSDWAAGRGGRSRFASGEPPTLLKQLAAPIEALTLLISSWLLILKPRDSFFPAQLRKTERSPSLGSSWLPILKVDLPWEAASCLRSKLRLLWRQPAAPGEPPPCEEQLAALHVSTRGRWVRDLEVTICDLKILGWAGSADDFCTSHCSR